MFFVQRNFKAGFVLPIALGALTAGCSLAPAITNNSLDYNATIEDVSNQSLVINVLRGRDGAPLYFPDLSQVRGAITASAAAQASLPYGPTFGTVQPGPFSIATAPTFDISPTNTKKFYQGLLNPVTKDLFAYFIERDRAAGDFAPTFNLMVDAVEKVESTNSAVIPWTDKNFSTVTAPWFDDNRSPVVVHVAAEAAKLGPVVKADAKAIIDADSAGLVVEAAGNQMQLRKAKTQPVICFQDQFGYFPISIQENSVVKTPPGEDVAAVDDAGAVAACAKLQSAALAKHSGARKIHYKLYLRSVEQMFYFLGAIVRDEQAGTRKWTTSEPGLEDCPRVAFYIRKQPEAGTRFSVSYRGETYYVADDRQRVSCGRGKDLDRTLPLIAILNDLLNLSRDADEVATTKAVQTVGRT